MPTSILDTIKTMLGIDLSNTDFDTEIALHINTNLSVLYQLGVLSSPQVITGNSETWSSLIGSYQDIEMIKTEIYLSVKLIFDPPVNASVLAAYQKSLDEYQFRLREQCDPTRYGEV